jgi:hypothetical protein
VTVRGSAGQLPRDLEQAKAPATAAAQGIASSVNRALATIGVGVGVAALLSQLNQYVQLAERQIQAEQRVAAVVRATGKAAGFTAEQLREQAAALQRVTTVGDEEILELQAIILTFRNITGQAFKETTELALDLATVMGQDARSGALQLGKALEDPIRGVTALRRSGVSFNEQQKEQIKLFVETNQLAKAQALILETVKGQIGGVAKAMADTDAGELQQARNVLGDIREELGRKLIPIMTDLYTIIGKLTKVLGPFLKMLVDQAELFSDAAEGLRLMVGEMGRAAQIIDNLTGGWLGLSESIERSTAAAKEFGEESEKATRKSAEQVLSEAQARLRQAVIDEKREKERAREAGAAGRGLGRGMGIAGPLLGRLIPAMEGIDVAGREKAVAEAAKAVQEAQARLMEMTRGPKEPDYRKPMTMEERLPVFVGKMKEFVEGLPVGARATMEGFGAAFGLKRAVEEGIGKGIQALGQFLPREAREEGFTFRFPPEMEPLIGAGRHGFRDFGRSIQDALLRREDPLEKLTKEELEEVKKSNRLLGAIAISVGGGLAGVGLLTGGS